VTVVKDGARGAWGVAPGTPDARHAAVPAVPVVDATGAGDVFDAAFLDAWIDGVPLEDALYAGAAAGAAAVGRIGGATGAPTARPTRERSEA
jgi:sugar/nucleoside kinase (ribokinase family)